MRNARLLHPFLIPGPSAGMLLCVRVEKERHVYFGSVQLLVYEWHEQLVNFVCCLTRPLVTFVNSFLGHGSYSKRGLHVCFASQLLIASLSSRLPLGSWRISILSVPLLLASTSRAPVYFSISPYIKPRIFDGCLPVKKVPRLCSSSPWPLCSLSLCS